MTIARRTPEDILEHRFIKEHLRKDVQFAINQTNMFAKCYYNSKHRWEEFEIGDEVWLRIGTAYRPKGKTNKWEMPRRLKLYSIVRKISPLAYELDLSTSNRIHPIISIAYLIWYHVYNDLYNRVPPPSSPIKYRTESDSMSENNERDDKR